LGGVFFVGEMSRCQATGGTDRYERGNTVFGMRKQNFPTDKRIERFGELAQDAAMYRDLLFHFQTVNIYIGC
jgi:hypothetical protein